MESVRKLKILMHLSSDDLTTNYVASIMVASSYRNDVNFSLAAIFAEISAVLQGQRAQFVGCHLVDIKYI